MPASEYSKALLGRLFARSERFVAGRHWSLEVLLLAVLFSAFFCGGIDDRLWRVNNNYWPLSYFQKIEHPLLDVAKIYPPESHDAKLNFRLTVPVALHFLGFSREQHWALPALTAFATCGIILTSCAFAFRVTRDRVCGLFMALAVSSTYIGSFGFMYYYDAIAICQLALAMLPGMGWPLKAMLVFTACFTDERAFVAAPFLILQSLCSADMPGNLMRLMINAEILAVAGAMTAYCTARILLAKFAGLSSPLEDVGPGLILSNMEFWHSGTWYALKGGWLIVGIALISLWQRRRWPQITAFALITVLCLVAGFLVEDVGRSTAYLFPSVFVALMVVASQEKPDCLRIYCLTAFVISALTGDYVVWCSHICWLRPLWASILHEFLRLFITPV